ncbi:MAG: hypothetical protein AAGK82_15540 [Pseudomonadota bacterium]
MQQDRQRLSAIDGVEEDDAEVGQYAEDLSPSEDDLEAARDQLAAAAQSDAIRQLLVQAPSIYDALASQVGHVDESESLAALPQRIEAGESEILREDLVYQSPDWERSTGRRDNSVDDLIG